MRKTICTKSLLKTCKLYFSSKIKYATNFRNNEPEQVLKDIFCVQLYLKFF